MRFTCIKYSSFSSKSPRLMMFDFLCHCSNRKLEDVTRAKSLLEQTKIELDSRLRSLQYSMNEELEKRKNAELLYSKCKEQLERKEEQYTA